MVLNIVVDVVKPKRPLSWTSTPDLDDKVNEKTNDDRPEEVVNVHLPRRRHTTTFEPPVVEESFTLKRPPRPRHGKEEDLTISRTDSLAERVRKMQLLKKQNSLDRELRSRQSSIEKYEHFCFKLNSFVLIYCICCLP